MSECQFDHVVVIGYGVVTGEVLKTVYSLASKYYTEFLLLQQVSLQH